eukprot:TRINITY_DN23_c0_g1_i1.p1 TRINITY_DN23_c0_g1~~TRINITY_DN23_c0_g1_i1.p1  ORF type:complete len:490 (+),score=119.71 TRINITY_DN23_c0_g1_i1:33-1472(+)
MSLNLTAINRNSKAKDIVDKRDKQRKKGAIVLIQSFLLENGYIDSLKCLEKESNIDLTTFQPADNVDLDSIINSYQNSFESTTGRFPILFKKNNEEKDPVLSSRKRSNSLPRKSNSRNKEKRSEAKTEGNQKPPLNGSSVEELPDLSVSGTTVKNVNTKKMSRLDSSNEEMKIKPGLPDFVIGASAEYQEYARNILAEIVLHNPSVKFSNICGLDDAKRLVLEGCVLPMRYPQLFSGLLSPWKGVLLYGPPGTGKTMLAKAVASECQTTFFNIKASTLISKWRGDSEKLVRILFDLAKYYAPSTIFLDEIDMILSSRQSDQHEASKRMRSELLVQLDGLEASDAYIFVLVASNHPFSLDPALLRRLEKRVHVGLPNEEARYDILCNLFDDRLDTEAAAHLYTLAKNTEGYSGSDLKTLAKEAAMQPLRRLIDCGIAPNMTLGKICSQDLKSALEKTKSTATQYLESGAYEKFAKQFGSS